MARIPQRFIDDLLDRVDIVDVVGARIDLRKSGKNYSARCPFHDEKTPSFSVSPDKQFYYCFGCGAGGNALGFVMDHDHVGFVDAVDTLAKQCGMEIPRESPADSRADTYRRKLYNMLGEADRYFRNQLRQHPESRRAVDYLKNRGLSGEVARNFGIGFAPPGWDNLINQLCLDDADVTLLTDAGMAVRKDDDSNRVYDRFRNRIIFPIRDTRGRTIAFGGRVLDDSKPKYLNSPETPVFHKSRELYGLYEAHRALREINSLMVVEGYMDVVALNQYGIHNVVATLGTAATSEHLEKLFRYTPEVLFCFDGDKAGRNAARRALETSLPAMEDGRSIRFLFLDEGEDPDTLVRKLGKEAFEKLMTTALPLSEFLFSALAEQIDTSTLDGKARLSQRAAPLINRIPDGVFKQLMLKELARRTDMEIEVLTAIVSPPADTPAEPSDTAPYPPQDGDDIYPIYDQEPSPGYADFDTAEPPYPDTGEPATSTTKRLKLSAMQRLILLLLHNPSLRTELEALDQWRSLDDPDAELLINLCALLEQNPHYTLNHILGYWRGIYGAERGEALARIVAADMLGSSQLTPRDDVTEFRDIRRHLLKRLESHQSPRQQLESLLARQQLTAEDRKRITLLQSQLSSDEKNALYQQIKKSLSKLAK
jgi:DNA primase